MTVVRIEEVMDTGFPRLTPEMPIREAVAALVARDAPAGLVFDDHDRMCGILTQKDCFRPALNASYYQQWTGTVRDSMSPAVVTIPAGADLVAAAEMFLEKPHRVVAVMDGGTPVGMLQRAAVLAALLERG